MSMAAELPARLYAALIPSRDLSKMSQDRYLSYASGDVIPFLVADCAIAR
jgi:hypothetical protein